MDGDSPSLLDYVGDLSQLASQGAQVYNSVTGRGQPLPQPTAPKPTPAPIATASWQKYLPLAIGGLVLVIVLGIVFRRS